MRTREEATAEWKAFGELRRSLVFVDLCQDKVDQIVYGENGEPDAEYFLFIVYSCFPAGGDTYPHVFMSQCLADKGKLGRKQGHELAVIELQCALHRLGYRRAPAYDVVARELDGTLARHYCAFELASTT